MIKYDKKWCKNSKLWHFKVFATEPKVGGSNPSGRTKTKQPFKSYKVVFYLQENPRPLYWGPQKQIFLGERKNRANGLSLRLAKRHVRVF